MIQDVRAQTMNLPSVDWPALRSGKGWLSAAILIAIALIVLVRVPNVSPAAATGTQAVSNSPAAPQSAASAQPRGAASAACTDQVWPYVTSGCLQGTASSENVRVVVGHPPPDAQTQAREADERYNKAMHEQPRKRDRYNNVMRERRARRNATFF